MAIISTNVYGDIDLIGLSDYWWFGSDTSKFGWTFSAGNFKRYTFLPDEIISRGFIDTKTNKQYFNQQFLNKSFLQDLYTKYQPIDFGGFKDFNGADSFYNQLDSLGFSTSGILIPDKDFRKIFSETPGKWQSYEVNNWRPAGGVAVGEIRGMGEYNGQLIYIQNASGNRDAWAYQGENGGQVGWTECGWLGCSVSSFFSKLAGIPFFSEIAGLIALSNPATAAYAPYIYAGLKGGILGAQGVDPLKAGLMVGVNLMAQNLASNAGFAKDIGKTLGATTEAVQLGVGQAVIGASVNGIRAGLAGGDVAKAMLEGAVTAGASSLAPELANKVLGDKADGVIKSITDNTNLTRTQVQTIVASSFVSGIADEIKGGDFGKTFVNNLISSGVSQSTANSIGENFSSNISPETRKAIVTGASTVARTATNAALEGKDITKALEANLPSAIYSTMGAYFEQQKLEREAKDAGWDDYAQKLLAQTKYGKDIKPVDFLSNEQFIQDAKDFTYDASEADSLQAAINEAKENGFNTVLAPDGLIYTLGGKSLTSMDTFVQAMNPDFDPQEYKKINNLGADVDAADHYLNEGQYRNLPVSFASYVDKIFGTLPEYDKEFFKEEFDTAVNLAKSGQYDKVDEIAKFIDKTFTTENEAKEYVKSALQLAGIKDREPTAQEIANVRGQNEANAYTIAQSLAGMAATTFDGTKYATPKEAAQAAKAAGYNTFYANDGGTYRVMGAVDEANIRANIEEQKTFRDAFAMARAQLGEGKTFMWNGKQYTTQVLPDDVYDSSRSGSIESAATLAYANGKSRFIGPDGKIYTIPDSAKSILENSVNQSEAETKRLLAAAIKPDENESKAETQRLMETPGRGTMDNISAMASQALGTTQRGIANLLTNAGKTYAAITGDLDFDNAATRLGAEIEQYAKGSDIYGLDVQKDRIQQALRLANETDNIAEKTKIIGEAIKNNPIGFFDIAGSELVEEAPETALQIAIVLGTGGLGAGAIAGVAAVSAAGTVLESFGNSTESAYKKALAQGDTEEEARNKAYLNGVVATAIEIGPEMVADAFLVAPLFKAVGNSLAGLGVGYASSTAVGFATGFVQGAGQSYAEQLIVNPDTANFSYAVTDGIFESFITGTVSAGLSVPGYSIAASTIIGKDYQGNNVSIDDIISSGKTVNASTINPDIIIGRSDNGNPLTLGGAMTVMPEFNFNPTILQTYAPTVFANPNLVVGKDALGNNVTYTDLTSQIGEGQTYSDVFKDIVNPTIDIKKDAQKIFLTDQMQSMGFKPTESQVDALIVDNPNGSIELENKAKSFVFQEAANEENYNLSPEELAGLLSPNSTIKTVDEFKAYADPLSVTPDEARQFLANYGYTQPTQEQIDQVIAANAEDLARPVAEQIADPYFFDAQEIKAIAESEGYAITDEEANALAREADEAEASIAFRTDINPKAVTQAEALEFFKTYGYTPTADEITQFVVSRPEADVMQDILNYVDPRQVTRAEAEQFFSEQGFIPTEEEIQQFIRQGPDILQADVQKELGEYVDPRLVSAQEVRDAYAALGLEKPMQSDIDLLVGQYEQDLLSGKAAENLQSARLNYLTNEFEQYVENQKRVQQDVFDLMSEYEKSGISRDEALNKAINDVSTDLGIAKTEIYQQIGSPAVQDDPSTEVDEAQPATGVYKVISDYEEAARLRDEQIQQELEQQEIARRVEAGERAAAAQRQQLLSKAPSILEKGVAGILPFLGAAAIPSDDGARFKDPFITSKTGQEEFGGSLQEFQQKVAQGDYLTPEFDATQMEDFMGMPQNTQQGELMPNYFTYGEQSDIDQIFNPFGPLATSFNPFENMFAKQGGLATPLMARGGLTRYGRYAGGGIPVVADTDKLRIDYRQGDAVTGPGDGQSDDIPAMLADGEFVIPADVVAALGNGSTKAGSDKLYDMMHSVRAYHRSAHPKDLPPPAKKNPLDYLKGKGSRR